MASFLVAFGLIGILVAGGVGVSLYLFNRGVIGRRGRFGGFGRRTQSVDPVTAESTVGEEGEDPGYVVDPGVGETARYARNGLLLVCGGLLVVGVLLTTLYNLVPH